VNRAELSGTRRLQQPVRQGYTARTSLARHPICRGGEGVQHSIKGMKIAGEEEKFVGVK
jgi:hypothetical protein